jgi:hypothetical protein
MRDYRFCVALRGSNGAVGELVREEILTAHDAADAIALAKNVDVDMIGLWANAIYQTDLSGHVRATAHRGDWP